MESLEIAELNIHIEKPKKNVDITSKRYRNEYILSMGLDMHITSGEECTKFYSNLSEGLNVFKNETWIMSIRNDILEGKEISAQSGIRFSLYHVSYDDFGGLMKRHVADAVIYWNSILNANTNMFSATMYDYPLIAEEELSNAVTAMKDRVSDEPAHIKLKINNWRELQTRFLAAPVALTNKALHATKELFMKYIDSTYDIYKKIRSLLPKYKPFIVPFYVDEGLRGMMEPSALVHTVQQFVGPMYEMVYFNALLSAMWQHDTIPSEFMKGAMMNQSDAVSGKYHSGYVTALIICASALETLAINIPYASDKDGIGIDVDDPEKQIFVKAWDCEDGGMFIFRFILTLLRYKNYWQSKLVKTMAELISKHYVPVLGKLVCAGVPQKDEIVKDHPELCHVLCMLYEKQYFSKLMMHHGNPSTAEVEVIDWPAYMFFSDSNPPPSCCWVVPFVEHRWEEQLLEYGKGFEDPLYFHEPIRLPPVLALESTALSTVFPGPEDYTPGGELKWKEMFEIAKDMYNGATDINSEDFTVCVNIPLMKTSDIVCKNVRQNIVSTFYNAVISIAVLCPQVHRMMDAALGRTDIKNIPYHEDAFVDVVLVDIVQNSTPKQHIGTYGEFYTALSAGSTNYIFEHKANLPEAVAKAGVMAFLSDRPILFPVVDQYSMSVTVEQFAKLVEYRNFISIVLVPRRAVKTNYLKIEYVAYRDPESDEPFTTTLYKYKHENLIK